MIELLEVIHISLIVFQQEYDEIELKIPILQGFERTLHIVRSNVLKNDIWECKVILKKYKSQIRQEKLNQLGIEIN